MRAFCLACLLTFATSAFAGGAPTYTDQETGFQFTLPAAHEKTIDIQHCQSGCEMVAFLPEGAFDATTATIFAKVPFSALDLECIEEIQGEAVALFKNTCSIKLEDEGYSFISEPVPSLYHNENLISQRFRFSVIADEEENSYSTDTHVLWNEEHAFILMTFAFSSEQENLDKLSETLIGSIVFE